MDESSPIRRLYHASPLRIGLLVDSFLVSQYIYDFVRWTQSHPNMIVTPIIVCSRPETKSGSRLTSFLRRSIRSLNTRGLYFLMCQLAFFAVEWLERAIIKRDRYHSGHLLKCDLSLLVNETLEIRPIISDSGSVFRFEPTDVGRVKELNFDLLLLMCESIIPRGEILNASKLGLISLRYGDDRVNRSDPTGFWEVYFQQDTTGFTIQRLTDDVGANDILMRGLFATRHYYLLNQAFIVRKAHFYLKQMIELIAVNGKLPEFLAKLPYSQKLRCGPTVMSTIVYSARRCYSILFKRLRRLLGIDYRITVAYVQQGWRNAELCKGTRLKNPPCHYLADPFVIHRNGKNYCFVEDFDYLKQRGAIAVYELTNGGSIRVGVALEEDFHLSFPYLFEYRNELFMCPESSENKDIRIYRCIEFPLRWKLELVAMENISAADTLIFQKDGKWWLFTNIDAVGVGDHCSELYIFSANSPLETRWEPHPLNPVIVDASRARNAGLIVDGEAYFRCSQGQGFDLYGKRILINEIVELTNRSYLESCSTVITPTFANRVVGTHHLHSNGKITVFDFVTSSKF